MAEITKNSVPPEFLEKMNTAREVLADTFPDNFPWTLLGYSGFQIQMMQEMLQMISEGESSSTEPNFKNPYFQHL